MKSKVWKICSIAFPLKNNNFPPKCHQEGSLHNTGTVQLRSKEGWREKLMWSTSSTASCAHQVPVLKWEDPIMLHLQHKPSVSMAIHNTLHRVRPKHRQLIDPPVMVLSGMLAQWLQVAAMQEWGALRALNRNASPLMPKHSRVDTCHLNWVVIWENLLQWLNPGEFPLICIQKEGNDAFLK